ncbi:MAG TPA: DUF4340 domain-containing protein [Gammaproteobacteria bacterium]|nr:DUF4340 domain-containing protein [Gammaproteobacteria bacterium]
MTRRWLLNLILLAILGALLWVTVHEPGLEPEQAELPPLTGLTPEQIDTVKIERRDQPTVAFKRRGQGWVMTEPYETAANPMRLDSLALIAQTSSHRSFLATDADLAGAGLARPGVVLHLNDTVIRFGGVSPVDGRRYVEVNRKVHLITDMYYTDLVAEPAAFVARRLLPEGAHITALTLPGLRIWQRNGLWTAEPPADPDNIQALVDEWQSAQAIKIRAGVAGAGERDAITVQLDTASAPLTFSIVRREGTLVLFRPDPGLEFDLGPGSEETLLELPKTTPPETEDEGTPP